MKNVKKAFLGVTLGASLCAGLLVGATPVHADMLWFCTGTPPAVPAFVIQCPDPIFVDGVRYRNVGVCATT